MFLPTPGGLTHSKLFALTDAERAKESRANEQPQYRATITNSFALGRYLVTILEFAAFISFRVVKIPQ
jgi:formylglycine-generating enzyme required for sulfatase activity